MSRPKIQLDRLSALALSCVLLISLAAGCTLYDAARTLVLEPLHFSTNADLGHTHHRAKKLAHNAWLDVEAMHGDTVFSVDYGDGFRDGFAEYYLYGGDGTPPPLPPRKYWDVHHRDAGQGAAAEWFSGYMHGVTVASCDVGHPTVSSSAIVLGDDSHEERSLAPIPMSAEPILEQQDGIPLPVPQTGS